MHDASNPSKHSVIALSVEVPGRIEVTRSATANLGHGGQRIEWHKAQPFVGHYRREMERLMSELQPRDVVECRDVHCSNEGHLRQIDAWAEDLVHVALAADLVFPRKQILGGRRQLCGWNDQVQPFKQESKWWFETWQTMGRPREGVLFENMRESKRQYMYAVRRVKRRQRELKAESFARALSEDRSRDFFSEVRKMFPRPTPSNLMDGITDENEIASQFADKYEQLYNSLPSDHVKLRDITDRIEHDVCVERDNSFVTATELKNAVKKLKHSKSDGDVGFYSSHLIYASESYHCQLALLFNSMYVHGYVAVSLMSANILSIPKDYKKSLSDVNNYRGIALCSAISKLMDLIIMKRNEHAMRSSELQFAFKAGHSTAMCTYAVKEIVKYYMNHGSKVYACFLDATKAFDRVQFDQLFSVLMDNGVLSVDLRLLLYQYVNQKCRAQWKSSKSEYFSVGNGIRQGGIASPILFCMYLDVLKALERKGIGCHIGSEYFGCLAYADDIVLLSPSISGLRSMLKTCEEYCEMYKLKFNASKSACVCFRREKSISLPSMSLSGLDMEWFDEVKHLGNIIVYNLCERREVGVKRGDLVGRVNGILANFNYVSIDVKLKLFSSQCAHFYGCQAWNLSDNNIQQFYAMYNQCVRRLLQLPYRTHTRLIPHLTGRPSVEEQIAKRVRKFISTVTAMNGRVGFLARMIQ